MCCQRLPKRMQRPNARGMARESGGLSRMGAIRGKNISTVLQCGNVMLRHG